MGSRPERRARVSTLRLTQSKSLGEIAQEQHGDKSYWQLLAAINKDRGYFDYATASSETQVAADAILEFWHPSRYFGTTAETRIRIAAPDIRAAYDRLLADVHAGAKWNGAATFSELDDRLRQQELSLLYSPAIPDGAENPRELSLKYYGSAQYWPLIVWVNPDVLGSDATGTTRLPPDSSLRIIHIVP